MRDLLIVAIAAALGAELAEDVIQRNTPDPMEVEP